MALRVLVFGGKGVCNFTNLLQQWVAWESLSRYGVNKARQVAQERGLDWDEMTEEEREAFVDAVVHEA